MRLRHENMRRKSIIVISILISLSLAGIGRSLWIYDGGTVSGERVVVSRVYDGDTIVVGRGWNRTTIRLIGVDTPETVRPDHPEEFFGPEASAFTRAALESRRVKLELEPNRPGGAIDHYGRTLAYVITDDGKNFNQELIRLGYGRAYTRYPFKYQREFKAAERAARDAGLGIWSLRKKSGDAERNRQGPIIGNTRSRIYHLPGQFGYHKVSPKNRVYFTTAEEAEKARFRKAKN